MDLGQNLGCYLTKHKFDNVSNLLKKGKPYKVWNKYII